MKLDDDPALQEYSDKIINTLEQLKANAKAQNTITAVAYTLKRLATAKSEWPLIKR